MTTTTLSTTNLQYHSVQANQPKSLIFFPGGISGCYRVKQIFTDRIPEARFIQNLYIQKYWELCTQPAPAVKFGPSWRGLSILGSANMTLLYLYLFYYKLTVTTL